MLQQILRDMRVDPEILAELDDAQKQTLFCKMREEQVRRWVVWDQKISKKEETLNRLGTKDEGDSSAKKKVQFLYGEDGEPWVWVMGEHSADKSIEAILLEEAREKAQEIALKEAEQLRKSVEKELTQLIDYEAFDDIHKKLNISSKRAENLDVTVNLYSSADINESELNEMNLKNSELNEKTDVYDFIKHDDEVKQEISFELNAKKELKNGIKFDLIEGSEKVDNKKEIRFDLIEGGTETPREGCDAGGVSGRVAAWERRVAAARAGEILRNMRQRRARSMRDAEEKAHKQDIVWREQERKAKEAELQMRQLARKAREEYHRTSICQEGNNTSLDQRVDYTNNLLGFGTPTDRNAIIEWYMEKELPRGAGIDENRKPAEWFHGMISRAEAESRLSACGSGAFLVRLSERARGYAISLQTNARTRHYLLEATQPHYGLLGSTTTHRSLGELVQFYSKNPITENGELLLRPAARGNDDAIIMLIRNKLILQ